MPFAAAEDMARAESTPAEEIGRSCSIPGERNERIGSEQRDATCAPRVKISHATKSRRVCDEL